MPTADDNFPRPRGVPSDAPLPPHPKVTTYSGCRYCDGLGYVRTIYDRETGTSETEPATFDDSDCRNVEACGDAYEHPICIGCGELIENGDAALGGNVGTPQFEWWRGLHVDLACVDSALRDCADFLEDDERRADLVLHVIHELLRRERERSEKRDAD